MCVYLSRSSWCPCADATVQAAIRARTVRTTSTTVRHTSVRTVPPVRTALTATAASVHAATQDASARSRPCPALLSTTSEECVRTMTARTADSAFSLPARRNTYANVHQVAYFRVLIVVKTPPFESFCDPTKRRGFFRQH